MEFNGNKIHYLVILIVIIFVLFSFTQVIPFYTTGQGYGGLAISEVDEKEALEGTIIQVNDTD